MRLLLVVVQLGWLCGAFAAEESCEGRCDKGFDAQKKCQCDDLCVYYQSCCADYTSTCKGKVTRGDVFERPEDEYLDYYDQDNITATMPAATVPEPVPTVPEPAATRVYETTWIDYPEIKPTGPMESTHLPDRGEGTASTDAPEEALCSGKPFDAFTSLKNGSIYAFRGKYFYELDEKSVRPGYPKLIEEVWGISGPIDAAFTRINCQGKTYIFQGKKYWRFDDGILDPGFPRNISSGFRGIPDDLDAAFALPAQNYITSERVYFFKGKNYWTYDFENQPSRQECEETSPSVVFDHYTLLQDDSWVDMFELLFGGSRRSGASRSRLVLRDWKGLPAGLLRLDAAMVGRLYVAQSMPKRRSRKRTSRKHRRRYRNRRRWGHWNKQSWDWFGEPSSESADLDWLWEGTALCQPIQSVYFFAEDNYYRLNLQTRRVDSSWVYPKYPRPIAKYWLGCPDEEEEDLA